MSALALSAMFLTMDGAAHAALLEAKECSQNVIECGGAIYRNQAGAYVYTTPIPGKAFGVDLTGPLTDVPKGYKLVADFHLHICNRRNAMFSTFFSVGDVLVNDGFHTIGYMLSLCDGMVRRFDPVLDDRDDEEVDFKPHRDGTKHAPIYLTIGHINGYCP